jgi:hypothetical protein
MCSPISMMLMFFDMSHELALPAAANIYIDNSASISKCRLANPEAHYYLQCFF